MASKTMVGARAKVYVDNVLVGLFDSCNYAVNIGAEPIFVLGRYSAVEIVPTSYEAVSVNCSGFRLIGNGGHFEYITLAVTDRQGDPSDEPIATIHNCVPVSYSTGYNGKSTSRIQISYVGTHASDESGAQDEGDGVTLP